MNLCNSPWTPSAPMANTTSCGSEFNKLILHRDKLFLSSPLSISILKNTASNYSFLCCLRTPSRGRRNRKRCPRFWANFHLQFLPLWGCCSSVDRAAPVPHPSVGGPACAGLQFQHGSGPPALQLLSGPACHSGRPVWWIPQAQQGAGEEGNLGKATVPLDVILLLPGQVWTIPGSPKCTRQIYDFAKTRLIYIRMDPPKACKTPLTTAGPPWTWNSAQSSPVKLFGPEKQKYR